MTFTRRFSLIVMGVLLLVLLPVASAAVLTESPAVAPALPDSEWWLVVHDQCGDTLRWINASGAYAVMPRPQMPNEAPAAVCSYRSIHISQDGRYLVQTGRLNNGQIGVGFHDLATGDWLGTFQSEPDEFPILGDRYSSTTDNQIAVGFANNRGATRGWRVLIFDMASATGLQELRSDGPEIASFVGGEFLATELTIPRVVLLTAEGSTDGQAAHIRFDSFDGGVEPFGAVAWYPAGAPGVSQALISSPYRDGDLDVLPNGSAIFSYEDPGYASGPPIGDGTVTVATNAIGIMQPTALTPNPQRQIFFADGVSTVYGAGWAADGRVALFRRDDGTTAQIDWIRMGTSVLVPLEVQVAQIIGVPTGFLYNTADGIYFQDEVGTIPGAPIFSDPALSGSMAFVWATPYDAPPLAVDTLANADTSGSGGSSLPGFVTATPGTSGADPGVSDPTSGICRVRSADGGRINVRTGPGTNYPVIGQMPGDNELEVLGYNGQWYVVRFAAGQGWVASWVTTLLGECDGIVLVAAPPTPIPPTASPVPTVDPAATEPQINFYIDNNDGTCADINWQVSNVREVYFQGTGVTSPGTERVCPASATTYTLSVVLNDGSTVNRDLTYGPVMTIVQPDLFVSEFSLNPATPTRGSAVDVRVGIYNQGTAAVSSTPFTIEWYPGSGYPSPACSWTISDLARNGGRILTCTYAGYPSPYASINTMVLVDAGGAVLESDESNNTYLQEITVNE
jgi:hypothetical protein